MNLAAVPIQFFAHFNSVQYMRRNQKSQDTIKNRILNNIIKTRAQK